MSWEIDNAAGLDLPLQHLAIGASVEDGVGVIEEVGEDHAGLVMLQFPDYLPIAVEDDRVIPS